MQQVQSLNKKENNQRYSEYLNMFIEKIDGQQLQLEENPDFEDVYKTVKDVITKKNIPEEEKKRYLEVLASIRIKFWQKETGNAITKLEENSNLSEDLSKELNNFFNNLKTPNLLHRKECREQEKKLKELVGKLKASNINSDEIKKFNDSAHTFLSINYQQNFKEYADNYAEKFKLKWTHKTRDRKALSYFMFKKMGLPLIAMLAGTVVLLAMMGVFPPATAPIALAIGISITVSVLLFPIIKNKIKKIVDKFKHGFSEEPHKRTPKDALKFMVKLGALLAVIGGVISINIFAPFLSIIIPLLAITKNFLGTIKAVFGVNLAKGKEPSSHFQLSSTKDNEHLSKSFLNQIIFKEGKKEKDVIDLLSDPNTKIEAFKECFTFKNPAMQAQFEIQRKVNKKAQAQDLQPQTVPMSSPSQKSQTKKKASETQTGKAITTFFETLKQQNEREKNPVLVSDGSIATM